MRAIQHRNMGLLVNKPFNLEELVEFSNYMMLTPLGA
jgi:hypothetical protein